MRKLLFLAIGMLKKNYQTFPRTDKFQSRRYTACGFHENRSKLDRELKIFTLNL